VIACTAGAVRTPGYASTAGRDAPGTLDADQVAERTLAALGRGPVVIPGFVNRLAAALMGRILPRRLAIRIMAGTTRRLSS
jgi:short-subunit dehydrogenase